MRFQQPKASDLKFARPMTGLDLPPRSFDRQAEVVHYNFILPREAYLSYGYRVLETNERST